jgi:hypothetical protein
MKFKKIVGFGDSWMWGDELLNPALVDRPDAHPILDENTHYRETNCFLGQVGLHYGVPVENFGIAGGSLQSTLWNYIWWTQNTQDNIDDCVVLIAHTGSWRQSFYNSNHISYSNDPPWNRYVHGAWVMSGANCYDQPWSQSVREILTLTQCNELNVLNYLQSVMFFEGQSVLHGNNVLQFCSADPPLEIQVQNLIWPSTSLATIIKQQPDNHKLLAKNRHPNESGHKLITQLLIDQINSCIIKG